MLQRLRQTDSPGFPANTQRNIQTALPCQWLDGTECAEGMHHTDSLGFYASTQHSRQTALNDTFSEDKSLNGTECAEWDEMC
jgi:hypothetical protein